MMRVLVTGGAGFIGSHVVDILLERGFDVVVLDDLSNGCRENLRQAMMTKRVQLITGSILDDNARGAAIEGVDGVIHMAVQGVRRSIGYPLENHAVNAAGTLKVLETCRRMAIRKFLYCSTSEVYGNASTGRLDENATPCKPTTVYGASKLAGENYTYAYHNTYGMDTSIVRPFNAYGPREHDQGDLAEVIPLFVIRVLCGEPPVIFGDGTQGRDFTYVEETAEGIVAAYLAEGISGQVINLAFGHMVTINQVAQTVLASLHRNDLEVQYIDKRAGDVYRLHASTKKAEDILGYRAKVPFEEGLKRYIKWFKANRPDPKDLLQKDPVNWRMPDVPSIASKPLP